MKLHLRATECHLPYVITQCYLPPDTSEHALPNHSQTGWYSIYLAWTDELTYVVGTYGDGLPVNRQSPSVVTSNQCRATSVIETNMLTTTESHHHSTKIINR